MHVKPARYQDQGCLHFITFSCYHRMRLLDSSAAKQNFERTLERVRVWYGCYIVGCVVMPEHVHLLISEPERAKLSVAIQMLKQITSQKLRAKLVARPTLPQKAREGCGNPIWRSYKAWASPALG